MDEIASRFSISELESILIHCQSGLNIAQLIREIEDPNSTYINPRYRWKFNGMLSRLRSITAAEEQTLITFSNRDVINLLEELQHFYPAASENI